jgi:hypothetical protein
VKQPFIIKRAALYKKKRRDACAINDGRVDRGHDDACDHVDELADIHGTLRLLAQQNRPFDGTPYSYGNVCANADDVVWAPQYR